MTTLRSVAEAQGLVIGLVLVSAGLAKLPSEAMKALVRSSALTSVTRSARGSRAAWTIIAGLELAVGLCVLALPNERSPLVAAGVLLGGALVYTAGGQMLRPGSPCGCFGSLSSDVSWWQSFLRTGLLLGCCLAAVVVDEGWTTVDEPGVWALVLVEVVGLVWLSPERRGVARVASGWISRSRCTVERWRMGPDCANAAGPPALETRRLPRTALWTRASAYLSGDEASDVWRDGCWEFAAFPGRYEGGPATVVFGIPLDPFVPTRTVAVVDETEQMVLHREELRGR